MHDEDIIYKTHIWKASWVYQKLKHPKFNTQCRIEDIFQACILIISYGKKWVFFLKQKYLRYPVMIGISSYLDVVWISNLLKFIF